MLHKIRLLSGDHTGADAQLSFARVTGWLEPIRIFVKRLALVPAGVQFRATHCPSGDQVRPVTIPSKFPSGAGAPPRTAEIQAFVPRGMALMYAILLPSGENEGEDNGY